MKTTPFLTACQVSFGIAWFVLTGCVPMSTPTTARMLPQGTSAWGTSLDVLSVTDSGATNEFKAVFVPAMQWRKAQAESVELGLRGVVLAVPSLPFGVGVLEGDAKVSLVQTKQVALALDPTWRSP